MPRENPIRKNSGTGFNTDNNSINTGVHQSLNVQAERTDLSGIQKGLGLMHDFYERKKVKQEKDDEEIRGYLKTQGELAASTGDIDPELEQNSQIFRTSLNKKKGELEGHELLLTLPQEAEEAFKADPENFDVDSFIQNRIKEVSKDSGDPDFQEGFIKSASQLSFNTKKKVLQAKAKAEHDEALYVGIGRTRAEFKALGDSIGTNNVKAVYEDIKELGFENDEALDVMVSSAQELAGQGNFKAAESILEFISKNEKNMGRFGSDLETAVALGKKHRQAIENEKSLATNEQKINAFFEQKDKARKGSFNLDEGKQLFRLGLIDEGELKALEQLAFTQKDNQIAKQNLEAVHDRITKNPREYFKLSKDEKKDYDEHFENTEGKRFADGAVGILSKMVNADPQTKLDLTEELGQLLTVNKGMLDTSQEIGRFPDVIKSVLNTGDLNSSNFEVAATMYQSLQKSLGSNAFLGISAERAAKLSEYTKLTERFGMDSTQAKELLNEAVGQPLPEARAALKRELGTNWREKVAKVFEGQDVLSRIKNIELSDQEGTSLFTNDIETDVIVTPRMQEEMLDYLSMGYRLSQDVSEAKKFAEEQFFANNIVIRGGMIPRNKMPKGLPRAWEAYQGRNNNITGSYNKDKDIISLALSNNQISYTGDLDLEQIQEDGFTLIPHPQSDLDGTMLVSPVGDLSTPLRTKDGVLLVINPEQVMEVARIRDEDEQRESKIQQEKDDEESFDEGRENLLDELKLREDRKQNPWSYRTN
jgi:hypothetical protein